MKCSVKDSITRVDFHKKLIMLAVKLLHFLLSVVLFAIAWLQFRYNGVVDTADPGFRYNVFIVLFYGVAEFFLLRTYNSYLLGYSKIRTLISAQILSQFFVAVFLYIIVSVAWNRFRGPLVFLLLLAVQAVVDVIWCFMANAVYFQIYPQKKTVLIYREPRDKIRFGSIKGKPMEQLYRITNEIMFDGTFRELEPMLEGYDAVFVAGVNSRCRNGILKYCKEKNVPGFFLPHIGDTIMQDAKHIRSFDSPVLYVERKVLDPEYAFIKRAFDIVSSLLGLIVCSPVMLITAIAIKAYDKGPVLYKQVRLTKDGREFKILKFRSMRVDAEKDGVARLSTGKQDDRITPIGRWIRSCRVDELPQLINILKGDMSVVGPRPERPEIAEQYYRTMPDFRLRLQVKAGLTGYAQIYGKYNTDPYETLEFDLLYINNMNPLNDLRMILATFSILFSPESTEGVGAGQMTALDYEGPADGENVEDKTESKAEAADADGNAMFGCR